MQHAKISKPDWQLPERPQSLTEHKAMTWAIHRLEAEAMILHLHDEQVIFVFRVMTGSFP